MPIPKTKLLPFDTPADAQSAIYFFFSGPLSTAEGAIGAGGVHCGGC